MRMILLGLMVFILAQCTSVNEEWAYMNTIDLGDTTPIGLTQWGNHIWISDGDHNQLIQIDSVGKILGIETGFKRPMHLDADGDKLYVPEYGRDQITIFTPDKRDTLVTNIKLDAPAGVDVLGGEIAIADFYNHQVLFRSNGDWIIIGKKGKAEGQFDYPTDVQITNDKIYVADAYNHRIQVFHKNGNHFLTFGQKEKMNAATGLYVSLNQVFVTDFENDRVLIYDHEGKLEQIIAEGLEKPTDILMVNGQLWVANYKGKNLKIFQTNT